MVSAVQLQADNCKHEKLCKNIVGVEIVKEGEKETGQSDWQTNREREGGGAEIK